MGTAVSQSIDTPKDLLIQDGQPLFGRAYKLVVGTLDVSQLACQFSVKKSLKPNEPNTCDLRIFNLNEDSRLYLGMLGPKIPVLLEAGYVDPIGTSQVYLGEVRAALPSVVQGPDILTELTTGDGEQEIARARINVVFARGTPPNIALQQIVTALGVGSGNIDHAVALLQSKGVANLLNGVAISGKAAYHLNNICKSANLEWSIQNGALQIIDKGKALNQTAIKLDPSSGLIGSPTCDNNGVANVSALMIPGLLPGRAVNLQAKNLQGNFRIFSVEYEGDTHGDPWYAHMVLKKLK